VVVIEHIQLPNLLSSLVLTADKFSNGQSLFFYFLQLPGQVFRVPKQGMSWVFVVWKTPTEDNKHLADCNKPNVTTVD